MTVLPIVTVGDPVLRERAREVTAEELRSADVQRLIDDMIETKRAANGAGLAANQVGETLRIAIVEVEPGNPRYPYKPPVPLTVVVNPELEPVGDERSTSSRAVCRCPTCAGRCRAAGSVRVRYLDRDGEPHEEVRRGLTAGTFQHEVDHLDGILFLDRVADPDDVLAPGSSSRHTRTFEARARDDRARGSANEVCVRARLARRRGGRGRRPDRDRRRPPHRRHAGRRRRGRRARLRGLTLPGLANAHSHAFQRALRGRTHAGEGSFWTWREQMYELAGALDPDSCFALSRAAFGEMALAGITCVGEFHYLHHGPDGTPYDDPNAMGRAVLAAARAAGLRITLLDACYLHGGIERFRDRDAAAWAERVDALAERGPARVGAAIHSVRAVDPDAARVVAEWAAEGGRAARARLRAAEGERGHARRVRPHTDRAARRRRRAVGEHFTAIHATHLTDEDVALLGGAGATICLCPTTERDLADGIGPARRLAEAGAALATGSDSHAVVDPFEEARAIELDERLATGIRGAHRAPDLLRAATAGGYAALGWPDGGRLEPGALADLTTLSLDSVRLAGIGPEHAAASAVYAATAADVRDVMVGGEWIVRDGRTPGLRRAGGTARGARVTRSWSTTSACSSPTTRRSARARSGSSATRRS